MSHTIHLQNLGTCPAKPAIEIKTGDLLSFNYQPNSYVVLSNKPASKTWKTVNLEMKCLKDGKTYTKKCRATQLVGVEIK